MKSGDRVKWDCGFDFAALVFTNREVTRFFGDFRRPYWCGSARFVAAATCHSTSD